MTNRNHATQGGAMSNPFAIVTPGTLHAGTVTDHGVVVRSTLTAYEMEDGEFVPFAKVHGTPAPVMPMVVFG